MKKYPSLGIQIPDILLPKYGIDLTKWAVIACDQFTSQPEYWRNVADLVGDAPSTYHLILPEVMLGTDKEAERIRTTQAAMQLYLAGGLFQEHNGSILVERKINGTTRKGIVLALDLECYDYSVGSQTLIRATEGTIIDRLPPRMHIREGAPLELPHILVLIDDPEKTVIEPLFAEHNGLPLLYDFDLMFDSGHLSGYSLAVSELEAQLIAGLERLADPVAFRARHGLKGAEQVLLFAMGDGNHSLATAKAIWEKNKAVVGMDHPSRYALVEIENLHDKGLTFEPIHRVLFGLKADLISELKAWFKDALEIKLQPDVQRVFELVDKASADRQTIGILSQGKACNVTFNQPTSNLAVGTLQPFIDSLLVTGQADKVDYIHGGEVVERLANEPGNAGFYLPVMDKSELFRTVILDGVLPRKTFSMGEAHEKRFYMECRRIA
ncbi:MAG: DUF1015 domain-containing protein [Anaerolineaceae bacterium]|mgnify:CR=1 FL=1|nr:DUF1015 domain-containing protein [Anaerolineaceae bacterium]